MSAMLKQKLIDIANGFTKYGLWKGGGSGNLSELDDVTLTDLQSNDVLTYNGSVWVNNDNLQTQINTLNSNFITLTATLGSVGTNIGMDYPTGFNPNNCIVSCAKLELAPNVFISNIYTGETMFEAVLFDTYIAFGTHSETAVGKKATIVLEKI